MEISETVSPLDMVWYGKRFAADFVYDRPFGGGGDAFHFFHFRNDIILLDGGGETSHVAGSSILYPPSVPQRFQGIASSEKPLLCDHVCFAASEKGRLQKYGVPLNEAFTVTDPQGMMDTILCLRTEERKARAHWRIAMRAYHTVMILQLAREATKDKEPALSLSEHDARIEQTIRDVCAMIDRNPAQSWVIADLAQIAGMSRGRFSAQFKRITGTAPQEYAIIARLREARVLLTNSSLSVGEIADRCGFSSAYYLSRLFSKRVGCPPSRYAEQFRVTDG